jgi:hypothetical protein
VVVIMHAVRHNILTCGLLAGGLLAVMCAVAVAAPQAQVHTSVDSTTVYVGESFRFQVTLTVNVEGAGARIGRPAIPKADGLVINDTPAHEGTRTEIGFVNGRTSRTETRQWAFYASPTREGEITLPGVTVPVDGQEFTSAPVPLLAQAARPQPLSRQQPRQQTPAQRRGDSPELTWNDTVFVEAEVDKRDAYQGEPLTLTVRIGMLRLDGLDVRGPRSVVLPETPGFYSTPPRQQQVTVDRNGLQYRVDELIQRIYPMRSGTLEISAFNWSGVGRAWTRLGGLESHRYDLSTMPIRVNVKPLPAPPDGFSGAVGRFRITASPASLETEQGAPVELALRVSGFGNPDAVGEPPVPALPWAHVSGPAKDVAGGTDPGATLTKTFTYTLTPLEPGEHEIPPVPLTYFEPGAGAYRTDTTQAVPVRVRPSSLQPAPDAPFAAGPAMGLQSDIWGNETRARALRPGRGRGLAGTAVAVAPPAMWFGFLLFMRRRRRLQTDRRYARDYYARSRGRERLRRMEGSPEPLQELFRALTGFLADKFDVEGAGMTSGDVKRLLDTRGVPEPLAGGVVKVLRACERDRYAGVKLTPDEVGALAHAAAVHMDRIEDFLKGKQS